MDAPPPDDDFGWYSDFESSWIDAFHYDPFTLRLWLRTKAGKAYQFDNFPKAKWALLKAAPSKGEFYAEQIKGRYQAN